MMAGIAIYISILLILNSVLYILLGMYSIKRNKSVGTKTFMWLMIAMSVYSLGYSFQILSRSLSQILTIVKFEYLGLSFIPTLWIILSLQYTGHEKVINSRIKLTFFIIPIITLLMITTNNQHHLFYIHTYIDSTSLHYFGMKPGLWYWVNILYGAIAIITGDTIYLVTLIKSAPIFRKQLAIIFFGSLIPLVIFLIFLIGDNPSVLDLNVFSSILSTPLFMLAIFKYKFLGIIPINRDKVFEGIKDGIIVLDNQYNIIDYNISSQQIFHEISRKVLGASSELVFGNYPAMMECIKNSPETDTQLHINKNESSNYYNVVASDIYSNERQFIGKAIFIKDITKQYLLLEKLNKYATIDDLTGAYNSRYFMELSEVEFNRAKRYNYPISYIMLDIDHFKSINDTYGHHAGNYILSNIANICIDFIRSSDIFGRYGGEEFSIFLPETSAESAFKLAERLCNVISKSSLEYSGINMKVTASFGVAGLNSVKKDDTLIDLFRNADAALYEAKGKGRNQVVLYIK
jgi:diguanylate cyclase (GGDEF)-like protein